MHRSINRSAGYECVPHELLVVTTGWRGGQGQYDSAQVQASLSVYAQAPSYNEDEYEPDYAGGCLRQAYEVRSGINGFDY